jgi:hypothetical protein
MKHYIIHHWSSWSTLVKLILVVLSFSRVIVWSSCCLVKVVLVNLSVVKLLQST